MPRALRGQRAVTRDQARRFGRYRPLFAPGAAGLLGGSTDEEIARRLGLSPRTVMHRASMMARLGRSSLSDAVRVALDAGIEPLGKGAAVGAAWRNAARASGPERCSAPLMVCQEAQQNIIKTLRLLELHPVRRVGQFDQPS